MQAVDKVFISKAATDTYGTHYAIPNGLKAIDTGSRLYRVRKDCTFDTTKGFSCLQNLSDVWARPAEDCTTGRLNQDGESVLYTSPLPITALEETRSVQGDLISLMVYETRSPVKFPIIGARIPVSNVSFEDLHKLNMIFDFFDAEFTRDVGKGSEHLYRLSEVLAKVHYDWPAEIQGAWGYHSVMDKSQFNLCFRAKKSKEKLKFVGAVIGVIDDDDLANIAVTCGATWDKKKNEFVLHNTGSQVLQEIYPTTPVTLREKK